MWLRWLLELKFQVIFMFYWIRLWMKKMEKIYKFNWKCSNIIKMEILKSLFKGIATYKLLFIWSLTNSGFIFLYSYFLVFCRISFALKLKVNFKWDPSHDITLFGGIRHLQNYGTFLLNFILDLTIDVLSLMMLMHVSSIWRNLYWRLPQSLTCSQSCSTWPA